MKEEQEIQQQNQPKPKNIQQETKQALQTLGSGQNPNEQFNQRLTTAFLQMDGTIQQKIKRLFNRLQKFFLRDKGAKINIKDGYFCKRRQPFYKLKNVYLVQNQIVLFGIDFAKHRDLIKAYQPQDFCPMDMSHVKLIFNNWYEAMNVLRKNQREQVQQNMIKLQIDKKDIPKGWMEMKPYYINNYERRILARFATSQELQIKSTKKLQSNIPLFAKKVYDLKKKQSQDIEENFQLRQQKLKRSKIEKRQKRYNYDSKRQYDQTGQTFNDQMSQKSFSYNIGRGNKRYQDEDDKSLGNRQRSREKDFDNQSISSKHSSLSSLAGKMNKNMNFDQKSQKQSIVSDASFILYNDPDNQQMLMDMARRLGSLNMQQMGNLNMNNESSFQIPANNTSVISSRSSTSYRLSENMPDKKDDESDHSFVRKPWSYTQYRQEQQRQQERKKQQQKQVVIVIDDQ